MKELYFENILDIGNIYLEKSLKEFEDENIVFICSDDVGNYYFSICYEFRYRLKWILCKVNLYELVKVLLKEETVYNLYMKSQDMLINIEYSEEVGFQSHRVYAKEIERRVLPEQSVYLNADFDVEDFINSAIIKIAKKYFIEKNVQMVKIEHKEETIEINNNDLEEKEFIPYRVKEYCTNDELYINVA